jgi:general secretion pathway protein D
MLRKQVVRAKLLVIITSLLAVTLSSCSDQQRRPAHQLPPANVARLNTAPPAPQTTPAPAAASADQPADVVVQDLSKQIFPGSGRMVGGRQAGPPTSGTTAEGDITLNFVNTDVKDVVRAVLGDILQSNFAIDPKIQGTITLQTNRPINRDSVLPVLESALRLNGLGVVRSGGVYTVTQASDAMRYGPGFGRSSIAMADQPGYGLRVVPLSHTSAEEIAGLLRSFMPPESIIRTIPSRNVLLLGGSQGEIATMMDTVGVFDVNWMSGMSFGLFTPRNVEAKTVVKELEVIFGLNVRQSGAGPIRIIPIERINAVLAIAPRAETLREVETWVDRLDHGAENVDARVYVYYVQNGRAADLAAALSGLLGEATEAGKSGRGSEGDAGRASLLSGGSREARQAAVAVESLTSAGASPRGEVVTADGGIKLGNTSGLRLKADEVNNALLILATPREYRIVEAALAKLDLPPLQVMIEAVVAEVSLTEDLRYGVQWLFQPGNQTLTLSQAASGAVAGTFPGFSAVLSKGSDIRAVLSMLEGITNVNVVSSPKLMVLNNQTATLQVGDQVPIATQSAVSVGAAGAPVVNTIQFRDTGVILKVTPRVNEGGLVLMDISQEVSDVAKTTTSNLDSPTIQQRKISSSISVSTGETIALGGLIRDRRVDGNSGVPLLKDIPLLGNIFKTTTESTTRTELLILITPQVVRAPADIRRVTQELRERLRIPSGMLGEP